MPVDLIVISSKADVQSVVRSQLCIRDIRLDQLCQLVQTHPGVELWLFGSALTSRTPADLDVLLLYQDLDAIKAIRSAHPWEHESPPIDIIAMTRARDPAVVQAAVSRQREYLADATGALTTRHPDALASALEKLGTYGRPMRRQNATMAHMWIADPTKPGIIDRLFSTHPPIAERVKRLIESGRSF